MTDLILDYTSELEEVILNNYEIEYLNYKCQWLYSNNLKESEIDFLFDKIKDYKKEFSDCDLINNSIIKFYALYDSVDNVIYSREEINF